MTDEERIYKLWQALCAARYELAWWADRVPQSKKRERLLAQSLARYDATIKDFSPFNLADYW